MHPERYPLHMKTKQFILNQFATPRKLRVLILKIEKKWSILWVETPLLDQFYRAALDLNYDRAFTLCKRLETLWLTERYGERS